MAHGCTHSARDTPAGTFPLPIPHAGVRLPITDRDPTVHTWDINTQQLAHLHDTRTLARHARHQVLGCSGALIGTSRCASDGLLLDATTHDGTVAMTCVHPLCGVAYLAQALVDCRVVPSPCLCVCSQSVLQGSSDASITQSHYLIACMHTHECTCWRRHCVLKRDVPVGLRERLAVRGVDPRAGNNAHLQRCPPQPAFGIAERVHPIH